jgi:hypothetical protein
MSKNLAPTDSSITDATLRKFNIIGCALHTIQGVLLLIASQAIDNVRQFSKMIHVTWLAYDPILMDLVNKETEVGGCHIAVVAGLFLLVSK